jgi:hypothetical protein
MRLFSTIYYDAHETLPWFLQHYTKLGIQSFHFIVQLYENRKLLAQVENLKTQFPIQIHEVLSDYISGGDVQIRMSEIRCEIVPNAEWSCLADPDEFQIYKKQLDKILDLCKHCNASHVSGLLVDRVARDGGLPKINASLDLEQQFPLVGNLTGALLGGCRNKVTLVRGDVATGPGQHFADEASVGLNSYVDIHHFKWRAGLLEKLQRRVAERKARGDLWWEESERFLNYFQIDNRINVEDPRFEFVDQSNDVFANPSA